ncbi:MAG: hypothetical protein ABIK28_24270, partial [Planctomycetota bacterium]
MLKKKDECPPQAQRTKSRKMPRFQGLQLIAQIVIGAIIIAMASVPSVHQYFSSADPGNPREAIKAVAQAIIKAMDVSAALVISTKGFTDEQFSRDYEAQCLFELQKRINPLIDPFMVVGPALDKDIQKIVFHYFEGYDLLTLEYVYDTTGTEKNSRSLVLMRFRPSSDGEQNLRILSSFIQKFVQANQKRYPQLDADSLTADMRKVAYWHLDHLLENRVTWIRIALGLFIIVVGLLSHMPTLLCARRQARMKYLQSRAQGYPVTSPSLLACLVARNLANYAELYKRCLDQQREKFAHKMARMRNEERRRKGREAYENMLLAKLQKALEAAISELSGASPIPHDIQGQINTANDSQLRIRRRLRAAENTLTLIAKHHCIEPEVHDQPIGTGLEQRLLTQVLTILPDSLLAEQRKRLDECMAHLEDLSDSPRSRLRIYWLEQALYAASDEYHRELETEKAESVPPPEPEPQVKLQPEVATTDDFAELLDIKRHVP